MASRIPITVKAQFDPSGQLTPLSFLWENGVQYEISKVLDCRRAVSLKSGGSGMRYTCRVGGKQIYLFCDDNIWYLEK